MKCRICGLECPLGVKICRDCASARKRAFAATVTQPLLAAVGAPSVSEARFVPRPARRRAANDSAVIRTSPAPQPEAALPLTVVPRRLGLLWFVVAAIIIVAVLLAIMRTASNGSHVTDEVVPGPPPAPVVSEPTPPAIGTEIAPVHPVSEAPAKSVASKPLKKPMPRVEPAAPVVDPAPAAEPPAIARAPAPARVVEAPRADPLQALSEGLAGCAREGFLDRMGCEQRLRAQYCGNSWGLVPQCPIGPATDHGQ
jgi:hypothetical protein